jgi:hypothetical protein
MKPDPAKLLGEALKLSPEARAALAASLLESLDEGMDEDIEAAVAAIASGFKSGSPRRSRGCRWLRLS